MTSVLAQPADGIDVAQLKRALVIKLRHHGDVLLTSPVLSVLKRAAPQCEIDAMVYADTAAMLRGHPALSQLHLLPRGREGTWQDRLAAERRLFAALRGRGYDLVVHCTDHPRGASLAWLLKPRWSVAFERDAGQWWWKRAFSHLARQPRGTPRATVERHLDLLRRLGIHPAPEERAPTLAISDAARERVQARLRAAGWQGERYALVHPGSRWMFKVWTAAGNAQAIDHIARRGLAVVLTAAPDARESALADAILQQAGTRCIDLRGQLTLEELGAAIAGADLFFGVDSVPMHIAAAVGTPGVALFGPSSEREWGPWSDRFQVVASRVHPCRPCGIDGCGGSKRSDCLAILPAADVTLALDQVLERHGRG
jgi:heptosyltransferase III